MDSTLVVIPTYQERANIRPLVERLLSVLPDAHVLVVDDASPDGTGDVADDLCQADQRVHVLHRSRKLGLGTAYVEGFRWALERGYKRVAQMDADGSHDPAGLPPLLLGLQRADVTIGSRKLDGGGTEGWSLGRVALSRSGALYCRLFLGLPVSDPTSGFRAFRRRALQKLVQGPIRSEGYAFQIEVAYRLVRRGCSVTEHPIQFAPREVGTSKLSWSVLTEAALAVPLLRLLHVVRAL